MIAIYEYNGECNAMDRRAMASVELSILGSDKLVQIFGHWPSFHDAEVINLHLWRGKVDPEKVFTNFLSSPWTFITGH